jgi:lipopolysaccharide export system permease protein
MAIILRILDKYIYKELYLTFFAVLSVLLLIIFGTETTRLLAAAVKSEIPSSVVFQVILYKIPPALEIILPLVALLSVMLAIGRLYQDQEMVVLKSCGVAERYFQWRVFWFLLPLALLTAWVSLFVTPWSFQQEREVISKAQAISPFVAINAGKFNELPNDKGVFYVKKMLSDKTMKNIWVQLNDAEKDTTIIAPTGKLNLVNGKLVMVLFNGISYQGLEKGQDLIVNKFEQFKAYLPEIEIKPLTKKRFETSSYELWQAEDTKQQAMLQWRIILPFSIIVLGLLGLKMSKTKPREGRFTKIFIALVLYLIFNQLLVTNKEMLVTGEIPIYMGLWTVPILFLFYSLRSK